MNNRFLILATLLFIAAGYGNATDIGDYSEMQKELIVLAAPRSGDSYYSDVVDDIFEFHVRYARQVKKHDDVLVLVDERAYKRYADAIGADSVVIAPMADIWMRDFGLSNPENGVMFRYTAAGQGSGRKGQADADGVQDHLAILADKARLKFHETSLLNDGGNYVDDYSGNVVISRKFLHDNNLTERDARVKLKALIGIRNVAFIDADEQGGLEHADGVVAFVDTNTLIVNSYEDDPDYARKLRFDLEDGLPGVTIHEIVTPYNDSEIYDSRFGSACGLYTNALVTPNRIYLPQFGIPQDKIAINMVRAITTREVVPIASSRVCTMGGGVRCMSWQLRGGNAQALLRYFGR